MLCNFCLPMLVCEQLYNIGSHLFFHCLIILDVSQSSPMNPLRIKRPLFVVHIKMYTWKETETAQSSTLHQTWQCRTELFYIEIWKYTPGLFRVGWWSGNPRTLRTFPQIGSREGYPSPALYESIWIDLPCSQFPVMNRIPDPFPLAVTRNSLTIWQSAKDSFCKSSAHVQSDPFVWCIYHNSSPIRVFANA